VRVVHLTWGLGIGGLETMLGDIATEQAVGHEIWIIAGNRDIDASTVRGIDRSVRLVTLGRPRGSANPWHLAKLILRLWQINPDVVHAHQESFGRIKRFIRAPMLLTVHSAHSPLGNEVAGYDSVVCISEAVRDGVLSRFPGCRPQVIRNGIKFKAVKVKDRYGGVPFRIVQVSRLDHDVKGQDVLIRALRQVLDHLGEGSVSADFIGGGKSLDYLRQLAVDCGVESRCRFLGAVSRQSIYRALRQYDLLVQPSRHEGFGLTIVEGIAAGLPVLVSDIPGPLEIIADGQLGWSFKCEDVEELSAGIIELIALSRESDFGDRMRGRAELARARFDIKLTAQRYVEEYASLAPGAGSGAAEDLG
jgi:glycosyltransferase involved in cell wall biosynthesis